MNLVAKLQETVARKLLPGVTEYYNNRMTNASMEVSYLHESMTALQLELENLQYRRLSTPGIEEGYTRERIMNIVELALQMGRKNPITVRSIKVQADYVFGQGVAFNACHPLVQEVIDEFTEYRENRKVLTSHTAMLRMEQRQQIYGSLFFVLNTNPQTGRVIVRNLPATEVQHIICHPHDRERELWIHHAVNINNSVAHIYHPAYGINEYSGVPAPWVVNPDCPQGDIVWGAPVLHVAANKLGDESFAIPEVYPQLDWAIALKRLYEQYTTIIASYARMAMKITGLKGKKQMAAAKALLATRTTLTQANETNPPSVAGSTALLGVDRDVEPIKTAGSTTPASDFDPIANFAGCAVGLPNTFFGDAGKGNFATAKTLDRPTELKMISRQKLWKEIFRDILDYVVLMAAVAPMGKLRAIGAGYTETEDPFTGEVVPVMTMPVNTDATYGEVGKPISTDVEVFFPDVLERNVTDRVRALSNALTLFGKPLTDIVPDKRLAAQWLLEALGVPNAKSYIPQFMIMWEQNMNAKDDGKPVAPYIIPPPPPNKTGAGANGAEDPSQGGDVGSNG